MARIKKYKMNPISKEFSEKGGFSAQFLSDGNSVDGESEILPGVIADGGYKISAAIAQKLFDEYFAKCLSYGARTGENVKIGSSGYVLMSIRGWYSNKDSKAKKENVRILFRLANEIRPSASFTLSNVNEGATLTLFTVKSVDCALGEVKPEAETTINGKYVKLLNGDRVYATVGEGEDKLEADCEVVNSDDDHAIIIVPDVFSNDELIGRDIALTVEGRCGDAEAGTQTKTITGTLVEGLKLPRIVSLTGKVGGEGKMKSLFDELTVKTKNVPASAQARLALYSPSGELMTDTAFGDTAHVTYTMDEDGVITFKLKTNDTAHPDGAWTDYDNITKFELLVGDTILAFPIKFVK